MIDIDLSKYFASNSSIGALTTSRKNGVSAAPYESLNLGSHVGDVIEHVNINRNKLMQHIAVSAKSNVTIQWLNQVHGDTVANIKQHSETVLTADASYTKCKNLALAILTADCLPILLMSKHGDEIAAIHAGWRPLAANIIANTVAHFDCSNAEIIAWLGPCIGPEKFEVGPEVKQQFVEHDPELESGFVATTDGKYLANLHDIARNKLNRLGVKDILSLEHCTHTDKQNYFSYRRDGQTGRMASLIYIK